MGIKEDVKASYSDGLGKRMRNWARSVTGNSEGFAQVCLVEQGALVGGEGFLDRHARLDRYRKSLMQASAPAYRQTPRQLQARPCLGISEEVEF